MAVNSRSISSIVEAEVVCVLSPADTDERIARRCTHGALRTRGAETGPWGRCRNYLLNSVR